MRVININTNVNININKFLLRDGKHSYRGKTVMAKIVLVGKNSFLPLKLIITLSHKLGSAFLVVTTCCTLNYFLVETSVLMLIQMNKKGN